MTKWTPFCSSRAVNSPGWLTSNVGKNCRGNWREPPTPLFQDMRALILRKCPLDKEPYLRAIFAKQPFGELERLVTQKLLDVVKNVAKEELTNETWLRIMARLSDRSYAQMRVIVLEFLDADIFTVSAEHCLACLEPLLESWDIDLATFGMEIVLNRRLVPEHLKQFAFVEKAPADPDDQEPGLEAFLKDTSLSGDATEEEIAFLKRLKFKGQTADPPLLLSGVTEPQRSAAFSHAIAGERERRASHALLCGIVTNSTNSRLGTCTDTF